MKKIFLLGYFLFLFAGAKAQQATTKKTDVIEYREGHSPQSKAQQKQVKNNTQAFPKPVDSVQHSAKMRSATGNQTIPKPVDSFRIKPATVRPKTADRKTDSLTQFIKG